MFTEQEIIDIFYEIDKNRSGSITMEEFYKGFVKLFPDLSDKTIYSYFRMHDKDKNGKLNLNEFVNLVRFMEKKHYKDDPFVILFDQCDVDGNGVLDLMEFCLVWDCIVPGIDTVDIMRLFREADKGNGKIDFNEYMDLIQRINNEYHYC